MGAGGYGGWCGDMMLRMGELILIRHGETEWSRSGRHTGRTDVALTETGRAAAARLAPALAARRVVATFSSPASRALESARLAGLPDPVLDPNLQEWDYGGYEGLTSAEVGRRKMGWYLWRDGVIPGDADHPGETAAEVGARADAVLSRTEPLLDSGDVALVAHGHLLRVLTARWLGLKPEAGRFFRLDTGTLSLLGFEHDENVISAWNMPPGGLAGTV
jgi:broad specificity phosphatase PhoE